jgi:hypothetical protein
VVGRLAAFGGEARRYAVKVWGSNPVDINTNIFFLLHWLLSFLKRGSVNLLYFISLVISFFIYLFDWFGCYF